MRQGAARQRHKHDGLDFENFDNGIPLNKQPEEIKKFRKTAFAPSALPLGYGHWFSFILVITLIFATSFHYDNLFPPVKTSSNSGVLDFHESSARLCLKRLSAFGPKVSGSYACEEQAFAFIMDYVSGIKERTLRRPQHLRNTVEIDVQRPSGCYDLDFLTPFVLCYRNVTNVVVRISPAWRQNDTTSSRHSLLFNSHFDSVPDSPGASDDGVSVCVMLELLRIYALSAPLKHDLIFLFNGAEENILQASHGFITQHPWRHSIRAFVNLEAAGAGGREVLFQAGPGNPWLVQTYLVNAKYPHTSIMAQEIFQSGFVPSDTDFRIFRDFGRIPGLDMAFTRNGYVYHTEMDLESMIPAGAIQRAGENIYYTSLALANSTFLSHPGDFEHLQQRWVYFDILGLFVIHYPHSAGRALNALVAALALLNLLRKTRRTIPHDSENYTFGYVGGALIVIVTGFLAVALTLALCVFVVTALGMSMAWYARPWLVIVLYTLPGTIAGLSVHLAASRLVYTRINPWTVECLYHDSLLAVLSLVLALGTYFDFGSSYYVLGFVLFPLLRELLLWPIKMYFRFIYNDERKYSTVFTTIHLLTIAPSAVMFAMGTLEIFATFIPILGRSGSSINPEVAVAGISFLSCTTLVWFAASLVYLSAPMGSICRKSLLLILVAWLAIYFTALRIPYLHTTNGVPVLKRLHLQHVERRVFDAAGSLNFSDKAIWVVPLDSRGVADLPSELVDGTRDISAACVVPDEFCGLPYYLPVKFLLFEDTKWLPVEEAPPVERPLQVRLLRRERSDRTVHLSFSVQGTDHLTLHITPLNGWALSSWSLTPYVPYDHGTFFVFLGDNGPGQPWIVDLHLTANAENSTPNSAVVIVGLGSHALHGSAQVSPAMDWRLNLIRKRRGAADHRWRLVAQGWTSQYEAHWW